MLRRIIKNANAQVKPIIKEQVVSQQVVSQQVSNETKQEIEVPIYVSFGVEKRKVPLNPLSDL